MRCDLETCDLDFAVHEVKQVNMEYVYLKDKTIQRTILGRIIPRYSGDQVLLTAFFLPKEAVLQMARKMCQFMICNYGEMADPAKSAWSMLMFPENDSDWFAGNRKANIWNAEFDDLTEKMT